MGGMEGCLFQDMGGPSSVAIKIEQKFQKSNSGAKILPKIEPLFIYCFPFSKTEIKRKSLLILKT